MDKMLLNNNSTLPLTDKDNPDQEIAYEQVLLMYQHEISNILLSLSSSLHFLSSLGRVRELPDEKLYYIFYNMQSTVKKMQFINRNIAFVAEGELGKREPIMEEVNSLKNDFCKWEALYNNNIWHKGLEIIKPQITKFDEERAPFKTDKTLFNQIFYNLFDNAVKYCYEGTKIFVDFSRKFPENSVRILSIVNYGKKIDSSEYLYQKYVRGSLENYAGVGLGLYIVKSLVDSLEGSVHHTCEKVSDFNIPLIREYLNRRGRAQFTNDTKLLEMVNKEMRRLQETTIFNDIVNDSASEIFHYWPNNKIIHDIGNATYKVTFEVLL